jgi:PAS domain S-box-containing protein
MSKNPLHRLHNRLESLFSGLLDETPRTGALSPLRLGLSEKESALGWVWETDAQGTLVWCSPEVEPILGYAVDEVIDRKITDLGFTSRSVNLLQQAFSAGEEIHDLRLEARTRSGDDLVLVVNALIRQTLAGENLGYRGVALQLDRRKAPAPSYVQRASHDPAHVSLTTPPPIVVSWADAPGYVDDGQTLQAMDDGAAQIPSPSSPRTLVVPIQSQEETIGFLEFEARDAVPDWSDDDRVLVEGVAQQLAAAMQDARTHQLTQQALAEMRQADRLKSQFLANMSHELRTPLNSIIGFSRVILKGIDGPVNETQTQDLQAIYNAGQHLLGLINDLLDISRIEAGKMELAFGDVDLKDIIRSVMSTATGLVKDKPIELMVDVPDDLPTIQADNIRVRQILLNLISNACKFTEQGNVGVTARAVDRGTGREVVVAVFDTGPGIAPADQARLFEPFSQVDASPTRKSGGTGLGLSICRQLVDLHGGRIWVESKLGEGSTFAFSLPVEGPPLRAAEPTAAPLLLVVDDDPLSHELLRAHLERRGYRLHALVEPASAVAHVADLGPSAVILDLGLPEGATWKTLSALRAHPGMASVPILLVSLDSQLAQGSWPGPIELLSKATLPEEITSLIRRIGLRPMEEATAVVLTPDREQSDDIAESIKDKVGIQGLVFTDGLQALAAAIAQSPDLILLDPQMDAPGGLHFFEALKRDERTRPIPVALLVDGGLTAPQGAALQAWATRLAERPAPQVAILEGLAGALRKVLPERQDRATEPISDTPAPKEQDVPVG